MAQTLLVALWCATATTVAAARYGDYSGARMPQYGSPEYDARDAPAHPAEPDDYRGHSPDAPAALDYKYEEELAGALAGKTDQPIVKEEKKEAEETDSWQRSARRRKKKKSSRTGEEHSPETHDRFDPEEDFPKAKPRNRFITKHRPRLKSRKFENHDYSEKYPLREIHDETQGYPISHKDKNDDTDVQDNEEPRITEDYDNYKKNSRGERVARRKPRDKFERVPERGYERGLDRGFERGLGRGLERESLRESDRESDKEPRRESGRESSRESDRAPDIRSEDLDKDTDIDRWMLMRGGLGRAPGPDDPYPAIDEERADRRRLGQPLRGAPQASDEDEGVNMRAEKAKGKKKNYDDYNNDYYDMKRVMNIKNKLPSLLRRTTVREEEVVPAQRPTMTTLVPVPDLVSIPGLSHPLQDVLANRRMFLPRPPASRTTLAPRVTDPSVATEVIPLPASTSTSSTTTTTAGTTTATTKETKNGTELSLAEKSRLSIMKKAMRKESVEGRSSTKKPPVLLQVTMKMPTIVMVEPPSSERFFRAREVYADSPARIEKVKRLMRHKIVSNAKNIHDLTDNWDDLVCDYIDMSLLENISAASRLNYIGTFILLTPVMLLCY